VVVGFSDLQAELGADFWRTDDRCRAIPDGDIIDQRTECYVAAGEPRFWRREAGGYGDDHEWTSSTAAQAPSSFARWLVRPGRATAYRIEAHVQGGTATAANYEIVHAGVTDVVTIDQSTADGFVDLGEFELAADGTEYVQLGDNTGTADQMLVFDALRVTAVDGGGSGNDDVGSGCATSSSRPGGLGVLLVLALAGVTRRRAVRARGQETR
jgi:hypothetical protein